MLNNKGRLRVSPFMTQVVIPLVLTGMLIAGFYASGTVRRFFSRGPSWNDLVNQARIYFGKSSEYVVPEDLPAEDLSLILAQSLAGAYDDIAVKAIVKALKQRARLVVIGTVESFTVASRDTYPIVEAQFYLRVAVSSVERGGYAEPVIEVYSGSYSNEITPSAYPPEIKVKYKNGDRVRMYVDDIPGQGYVLLGGYFSIEPLFSFPFQ